MKALKYICNKVVAFASRNIVISASLIFAIMLTMAGINIGKNGNGAEVTAATGILVILFAMIDYLYFAFFAIKLDKIIRTVMATGFLMILVEYISSVVYSVNLNINTSKFWCDAGVLLITLGIFRIGFLALKRLFTKK